MKQNFKSTSITGFSNAKKPIIVFQITFNREGIQQKVNELGFNQASSQIKMDLVKMADEALFAFNVQNK